MYQITLKHRNEVVRSDPFLLQYVPYQLRMQQICDKLVRDDSSSLQFVPDWLVTQQQIDVWYDELYDVMVIIGMMMIMKINFLSGTMGIKNERPRKQRLRKNSCLLLGIPYCLMDWCMSGEEIKKLWK